MLRKLNMQNEQISGLSLDLEWVKPANKKNFNFFLIAIIYMMNVGKPRWTKYQIPNT